MAGNVWVWGGRLVPFVMEGVAREVVPAGDDGGRAVPALGDVKLLLALRVEQQDLQPGSSKSCLDAGSRV